MSFRFSGVSQDVDAGSAARAGECWRGEVCAGGPWSSRDVGKTPRADQDQTHLDESDVHSSTTSTT